MKLAFWIVIFLANISVYADDKKIAEFAITPAWHKLMHYEKTFFTRNLVSRVDGPDFFISKNGANDPEGELKANLEVFGKDVQVGPMKLHPQCAFPLRYKILKKEFQLNFQDVKCTSLLEYMKNFDASKISMVFSSAYASNPGSMFGHTFFKVTSHKNVDFLDNGVSYAAQVGDVNPVSYLIDGIFGGFPGVFSFSTYYKKVNEYNYSENRDLYEYEINLTESEVNDLLLHVWELSQNTWLDYYFFDENCALIPLKLIEVVRPSWELTDLPLWVIPGEVVRKLVETPGVVREVRFRPSLRKKLQYRIDKLNSEQHATFLKVIDLDIQLEEVKDVAVIEAATSYFQYVKEKRGGLLNPLDEKVYSNLILHRQTLPASQAVDYSKEIADDSRPDLGHRASKLGMGVGSLERPGALPVYYHQFYFKMAYHDMLNDDLGFSAFSQLDMPSVNLRWQPFEKAFYVEHINIFSTMSLNPLNEIDNKLSFQFRSQMVTPKDINERGGMVFQGQFTVGATFDLYKEKAVTYLLIGTRGEMGNPLRLGYRAGPLASGGFVFVGPARLKTWLDASYFNDLTSDAVNRNILELKASFGFPVNQEWDFQGSFLKVNAIGQNNFLHNELNLGFNYYF